MRIDMNDAALEDDGSDYLYNGEPFTGEVTETHPNGTIVTLTPVYGGRVNGVERLWYPDGTPERETNVVGGRAVGMSREWHPNGQLAVEQEFDENGDLIAQRKWDENGKPVQA